MYMAWPDIKNVFTPPMTGRLRTLWSQWSWATPYDRYKLRAFQPKVRLYYEKNDYVVKTVESSWELEAALKLRYRVFHGELLQKKGSVRLDLDPFDFLCDHLIIAEKRSRRIIGTYRMMASSFSSSFYSAQEFDLSDLLKRPGVKLELGRACVDSEYRNGVTLALLWKGIHQYAEAVNAQYLFGCSSIPTMNAYVTRQIVRYFQIKGCLEDAGRFRVQPPYRFGAYLLASDHEVAVPEDIKSRIPPLLLSYIKAGARVGGEPALDRAFRCVDFLTILAMSQLRNAYSRKVSLC